MEKLKSYLDRVKERDNGYELTLAIAKPKAMDNYVEGQPFTDYIEDMFEEEGLDLLYEKKYKWGEETIREHYKEHKDQPWFEEIVEAFTDEEVELYVLGGENAIERLRNLAGKTDPQEAYEEWQQTGKENVRGRAYEIYGANLTYNGIHSADSLDSVAREMELYLDSEEVDGILERALSKGALKSVDGMMDNVEEIKDSLEDML